MSKILRDYTASSTFVDTLEGAAELRKQLLKSKPEVMTKRDISREAGRAEGYEIGFEQGVQEGERQGRLQAHAQCKEELDRANSGQIQKFAEGIDTTMRQFDEQQREWFSNAEEKLADLAIEIARRAIARELECTRESVVDLAHQVLEEVTESKKARLSVNPMDGSVMEACKTDIQAAFANLENIEVVEDRSIGFGCRLETDSGMIDARVEDYLARIVLESREDR